MLCIGDTLSAATALAATAFAAALGALPVLSPSMQAEAGVDISKPQQPLRP
jgi:hypothetical protein